MVWWRLFTNVEVTLTSCLVVTATWFASSFWRHDRWIVLQFLSSPPGAWWPFVLTFGCANRWFYPRSLQNFIYRYIFCQGHIKIFEVYRILPASQTTLWPFLAASQFTLGPFFRACSIHQLYHWHSRSLILNAKFLRPNWLSFILE